jgi:hypothetical protein
MIYPPLPKKTLEKHLVQAYKNEFPEEFLELLEYVNGFNLFFTRVNYGEDFFAYNLFTIFGLPMTAPFARKPNMEEPHDITIEDLRRHKKTPKAWLKCGQYVNNFNFSEICDIFIDTKSNIVYSCEAFKNKKDTKDLKIINEWSTLDDCLCEIFNSNLECKEEYFWTPNKK